MIQSLATIRALIISRNIQTREMSASAKAILLALEYPEPGKRGPKAHGSISLESDEIGFSPSVLREARQIVKWAGDEAESVLYGLPGKGPSRR